MGMRVPGPPGAARLEVGDATHVWTEGGDLLFDDSVDHEAWNDSDEDRYVFFVEFVWPTTGIAGLCNVATQRMYRAAGRSIPRRAAELDLLLNG